jgi:hexosaminidase
VILQKATPRLLLISAALVFFCSGAINMTAQNKKEVTLTLMPMPRSIERGSGQLIVTPSFTFGFAGFHDARLDRAVRRTLDRLEFETGAQLCKEPISDASQATLVLEVKGAGEDVQSLDEDESYSLRSTAQQVRLQAATVVGAMRGLSTFLQLVQIENGAASIPAVTIDDAPRFRWRGLMIDSGRHFEPVPVILRTLDGMAAVKLNVFHWHLTEDQGFRIESKKFSKLQEMGSDGLYYTQDEVKQVIAYARDRGIRVVPEFDMPGHTTSWFVGYPELASGPGPYTVQRVFGIHDPAMDPTRDSTYTFLNGFIEEMGKLFPDPYMHIGGDESNGNQWKSNPHIVAFMKEKNIKDTEALQTYFNQRLLKILTQHGKHMVGWDEIFHPDLPKDVVVQSWRGEESLAKGAMQGYQGILSAPYYFDAMKSAEQHYLSDPIPADMNLTPAQTALILGGEACMWGEHLNESTIDSRIWPRMTAIAERFWSPAHVRDVDDMYRRLRVESVRLEQVGLTHMSGPATMIRDLAGVQQEKALAVLASVVEPVSFHDRYENQHTDQLTPLDRLVDAVVPDPPSRHDLDVQVNQFLTDSPRYQLNRAVLEAKFRSWQEAAPVLEELVAHSPRLNDAGPLVECLRTFGAIGQEALAYLTTGTKPPAGWKEKNLAVLQNPEKPIALVHFTVVDSLQKLVDAAAK